MTSDAKSNQPAGRLPPWLKKRHRISARAGAVRKLLADLELQTVCCSAHCPNQSECFGRGTATFLILGDACTRSCRFCAIAHSPALPPPRADEPAAVAEACVRLGLRYVVVTSVTRDDLPDGGAGHFGLTIRAIRGRLGDETLIEVLTPDFRGDSRSVEKVLAARPDVFNHNVETAPRLYRQVRPQADYARSLAVLRCASGPAGASCYTKSGLMVGLGESHDEVTQVMQDLRGVGCDILTIGQYLAPSADHAPVERFVEPGEFAEWEAQARELGFVAVAAGPFVRSSYRAENLFPRKR
ncbi:MAG: lipoyl synthase [Planctomycetota bacterium]|nr:lipoyl synthase [Planctomycetota bacterium]